MVIINILNETQRFTDKKKLEGGEGVGGCTEEGGKNP